MSQTSRLLDLLSDGAEHSTREILEVVYGNDHLGLARVGARVFDLNKKGHRITGRRDELHQSLYWYKLEIPVLNPAYRPKPKQSEIASLTQGSFFDAQEVVINGLAYYQNTSSLMNK